MKRTFQALVLQNSPSEAYKSIEALRELLDSKDTVLFSGMFRSFSQGEIMKAIKSKIIGTASIAFFIFAGLTLTGCADDSTKSGGGNSDKKFTESYDFTVNGCPTKKHQFSGDSEEAVKKQYCEALQDHELNNSCAEGLRQDLFEKKCTGLLWKPKYKKNPDGPLTGPKPTPAPTPTPDQETTPIPTPGPHFVWDSYKQSDLTEQLRFALLEDSQVVATGSQLELAKKIQQAMIDCGFSNYGPKCLDFEVMEAGGVGFFIKYENGRLDFYSEIKIQNDKFLLRFKVTEEKVTVASHVDVLKIITPRLPGDGVSYFLNPANFVPLVGGSISANTNLEALRRLESAMNIRSLYHMAQLLLTRLIFDGSMTKEKMEEYSRILKSVARFVELHKNLITESREFADQKYQEAMLMLITSRKLLTAESTLGICNQLLAAKSEKVRIMAATFVLDAEPTRIELKSLVLKGLQHEAWQIRAQAVSAIAKTQLSQSEEILLLGMLADEDSDVFKAASEAAAKIKVAKEHFPKVKQLLASSKWLVRKEAVTLMGRIGTSEAIRELVGRMNDSDSDVRSEVVKILKAKTIGQEHLENMSLHLKDPQWTVRRDAASFIGSIGTEEAIRLLVRALPDSDADVREMIFSQLNKKTLTELQVPGLAEHLASDNWSIRLDTLKLIGKIPGRQTTLILVRQLKDRDSDVRNLVREILRPRKLDNEHVEELTLHLNGDQWDVRKDAALFLGKIKTPESLAALQSRLLEEQDSDVKTQIIASIKLIKN